eukprot:900632-Pelagomonas_calceolata.AAC.1
MSEILDLLLAGIDQPQADQLKLTFEKRIRSTKKRKSRANGNQEGYWQYPVPQADLFDES